MNKLPKLGVVDFINMIYHGHPAYTLMAVQVPLEETIQKFIHVYKSRKTRTRFDFHSMKMKDIPVVGLNFQRQENLPIRDSQKHEYIAPAIPFIAVKGSEWTVILRSLFGASNEIFDVPEEAKALSLELNTQAITLMEENTSVAIRYELFENGDRLESFEEYCGDDFHFESQLREKPKIKFDNWDEDLEEEDDDRDIEYDDDDDCDVEVEYDCKDEPRVKFVDDFFRELGIYLPACYPVDAQGKASLAVKKYSQEMIERADWLSMKNER